VLRGSEKDPDGGERNGGGNGRGARFANKPTPVSNRKGSLVVSCGGDDSEEV